MQEVSNDGYFGAGVGFDEDIPVLLLLPSPSSIVHLLKHFICLARTRHRIWYAPFFAGIAVAHHWSQKREKMSKVVLIFGFAVELVAIILSQISFIPDQMIGIVLQLPVVGLFLYFTAYILKWHSEQESANREAHTNEMSAIREVYTGEMEANRVAHGEQLAELFKAFIAISNETGDLGKQVAINTAVVTESIQGHELVQTIKDVLLKNKEERND